ncbi:MAG: hypothetical protein H0T54_06775, partial [Geodermatophilaceae bacterium]|nr:hypothetical protein [Geodermatophilaceae bacterium]
MSGPQRALLSVAFGVTLIGARPAVHGAESPRQVTVVGRDYAFELPRQLPPGSTTFRFENRGKVRHELNIFLLKPGVRMEEVVRLRREGKPGAHLVDGPVGVLFAGAHGRSSAGLTTDLLAGRDYAVICVFRDTANAPRHFEMGMYSVIRVGAAKRPARAGPDPDTVVGLDYAFRAPAVLSAGRHWLAF